MCSERDKQNLCFPIFFHGIIWGVNKIWFQLRHFTPSFSWSKLWSLFMQCESLNISRTSIQHWGQKAASNLFKVILQVSANSFQHEVYENCKTFASILDLGLEVQLFATKKCILIRMMENRMGGFQYIGMTKGVHGFEETVLVEAVLICKRACILWTNSMAPI